MYTDKKKLNCKELNNNNNNRKNNNNNIILLKQNLRVN